MSHYRLVSRAYPADYWEAHGAEIVATANELHDDHWSFRESRQLLANGLRTRSLEATGGSVRQVWISGLTIAVFLIVIQFATAVVLDFIGVDEFGPLVEPGWTRIGALASLAAMSISTRWPTMLVVAIVLGSTDSSSSQDWLFTVLIVGICGTIAFAGRGRRVMSPIAMLVLLGVLVGSSHLFFVFGPGLLIPAILIVSVVLVRFDGRLAAATSIYAGITAISMLVFALDRGLMGAARSNTFGITTELFISAVSAAVAVSLGFAVTRYTRQLRHL